MPDPCPIENRPPARLTLSSAAGEGRETLTLTEIDALSPAAAAERLALLYYRICLRLAAKHAAPEVGKTHTFDIAA